MGDRAVGQSASGMTSGGTQVDDHFYFGRDWEIGLKRFLPRLKNGEMVFEEGAGQPYWLRRVRRRAWLVERQTLHQDPHELVVRIVLMAISMAPSWGWRSRGEPLQTI